MDTNCSTFVIYVSLEKTIKTSSKPLNVRGTRFNNDFSFLQIIS